MPLAGHNGPTYSPMTQDPTLFSPCSPNPVATRRRDIYYFARLVSGLHSTLCTSRVGFGHYANKEVDTPIFEILGRAFQAGTTHYRPDTAHDSA
jgi:hypothetical protein